MGYYMGDASAGRHQGGIFGSLGKLIGGGLKKVAQVGLGLAFPGATTVLRAAGNIISPPAPTMGTFSPSTIPQVPPMVSSSPAIVPVHAANPPRPGKARTAAKKGARNLSGKVLRVSAPARRRQVAHRRTVNAATRARLRRLGYNV